MWSVKIVWAVPTACHMPCEQSTAVCCPRFKVLAECASMESWEKALALHAEMNSHGLELPPSELIEFIEV